MYQRIAQDCPGTGVMVAAERPSVSRRERAAQNDFTKPTISRAKRSAARGVGPAAQTYPDRLA